MLVNWGGDAITAYDEAYGQPFTKETGITVKMDGSGPTEGAIAAQYKSGKPTWDLVDADPFSGDLAGQAGHGGADRLHDRRQGQVAARASAGTMPPRPISSPTSSPMTPRSSATRPPTGMADFFDVEKFPGKRSLYKWGAGMWEAALLADGVAPEEALSARPQARARQDRRLQGKRRVLLGRRRGEPVGAAQRRSLDGADLVDPRLAAGTGFRRRRSSSSGTRA